MRSTWTGENGNLVAFDGDEAAKFLAEQLRSRGRQINDAQWAQVVDGLTSAQLDALVKALLKRMFAFGGPGG